MSATRARSLTKKKDLVLRSDTTKTHIGLRKTSHLQLFS